MKTIRFSLMLLTAAGAAFAQHWEIGGSAGGSFLPAVSVSSTQGSATKGFQPRVAASAYVGQNLYRHLSGEIRYTFMQSNLKLSSGGQTATFAGNTHAV